jgi:hypothetical protein
MRPKCVRSTSSLSRLADPFDRFGNMIREELGSLAEPSPVQLSATVSAVEVGSGGVG